jgi:lysophospholipase L1-like esterase
MSDVTTPTTPEAALLAALLSMSIGAHAAPARLELDFGANGNAARSDTYDERRGYGFEPPMNDANTTRFSAKLPEGNYRVTVRFVDPDGPTVVTIRAEMRRLMARDVATTHRSTARSFIVNTRSPALAAPPVNAPGADAVRLKPSEIGNATWDDKLTLEFAGAASQVAGLSIEPADVPTVYLAGDSTVTDQAQAPGAGWGQMLPRFFGPAVAIANHAEGGETLKSFLAELRLDKILATLRSGDWLLIQFCHNDQKAQWPQTYAEAGTTYRAYLRAYIAEARRRGATPVLITAPERRNFDAGGHIIDSHRDYPESMRAVAREEGVALIDLHTMSKRFYESLGPARSALAFGGDITHHNEYGAYELARMVVAGIRTADSRLAAHLASDAGEFDPSQPDPPENFQ